MTQYPERIAIRVKGTPIVQGNHSRNRAGKTYETTKGHADWRTNIIGAAYDQHLHWGHETITAPVRVWAVFTFERPRSHYRTGRNSHILKDTAPRFPTKKNDIDKLLRALFDALTEAGVWADDSLVQSLRSVEKYYAGEHERAQARAGCDIIIEPL
jgi:Holliday junction resolvase RusA-like endonuclease